MVESERHLLTDHQMDILLKNYEPRAFLKYKRSYCDIKDMYNVICNKCNIGVFTMDNEVELIENIERFLDKMRGSVSKHMEESPEMKSAMVLMLYGKNEICVKHKSFLNWISHVSSELGHRRLGTTFEQFKSIKCSPKDSMEIKVREMLTPLLDTMLEYSPIIQNVFIDVTFALRCFESDFETRKILNSDHENEKDVAEAQSIVLAEFLTSNYY